MEDSFIDKFHLISIRGRYMYAYLCLKEMVEYKRLPPLPKGLDDVLRDFVASHALDDWHSDAHELLPDVIKEDKDEGAVPVDEAIKEAGFHYNAVGSPVSEMVDYLAWIGWAIFMWDIKVRLRWCICVIYWLPWRSMKLNCLLLPR